MEKYFDINFEFDRNEIHRIIDESLKNNASQYICVADGNIIANVYDDINYRSVVNESLFSICDSGWAPIIIKCIYGLSRQSYCGSQIFEDILREKKYSMAFLGGSKVALQKLEVYLKDTYPELKAEFMELPFCDVNEFDYKCIADYLNEKKADVIWVGLGAPKQEIFMSKLKPFLNYGVMIGVGAVFNFYSGTQSRAPKYIRKFKLEFLYRLITEPKKQLPKMQKFLINIFKIVNSELKKHKNNS